MLTRGKPEGPANDRFASALVCTRNRAGSLVRAVRSLLADGEPELEVIVVDQSDGHESEAALETLLQDARLRYFRSGARGKGAALNEGLRLARGEIVVCTDDDCLASPGWIGGMARALRAQPGCAVLFCNVFPVPYDRSTGYVPAYERTSDRLLRRVGDTGQGHGLGAGMALRRSAVLEIGGFDEALGPGAPFLSAEDWDIANRALLRGWHVYETAELSIIHDGFRSFAQGREHAYRDWVGIGAMCAKPLRAGRFETLALTLRTLGADAIWPPLLDLLRLRRPRGVGRVLAFLSGFARGLLTPVDPRSLNYRSPPGPRGR